MELVIREDEVKGKVYGTFADKNNNRTYLVKLAYDKSVGLYISAIRAQESAREADGWWVQLPYTQSKGRNYYPFESSKKGAFLVIVKKCVIKAVKEYLNDPANIIPDDVWRDDEMFQKSIEDELGRLAEDDC